MKNTIKIIVRSQSFSSEIDTHTHTALTQNITILSRRKGEFLSK